MQRSKRHLTQKASAWLIITLQIASASLFSPEFLLAQSADIPMPAPGTVGEPSIGAVFFQMMPMFAMVFLIFYLLVYRPQQAKLKAHRELIIGLKRGDNIVTTGGILGRVANVEKDVISIEIAPNVKIKVESSHVLGKQKVAGEEESKRDDSSGKDKNNKKAANS